VTLKAVCRVGDSVTGTCTVPTGGHPRAFTGTWTTCAVPGIFSVLGIDIIRVGDIGITDCGHQFTATTGSTNVASGDGKALHRVGDSVTVTLGGSGASTTGSPIFSAE
jgi:hypothetical protein